MDAHAWRHTNTPSHTLILHIHTYNPLLPPPPNNTLTHTSTSTYLQAFSIRGCRQIKGAFLSMLSTPTDTDSDAVAIPIPISEEEGNNRSVSSQLTGNPLPLLHSSIHSFIQQ